MTTSGEHLRTAVATNMIYIAINYNKKANKKVASSNINFRIYELLSKQQIHGVHVTIENLERLDKNLLLDNLSIKILVK